MAVGVLKVHVAPQHQPDCRLAAMQRTPKRPESQWTQTGSGSRWKYFQRKSSEKQNERLQVILRRGGGVSGPEGGGGGGVGGRPGSGFKASVSIAHDRLQSNRMNIKATKASGNLAMSQMSNMSSTLEH